MKQVDTSSSVSGVPVAELFSTINQFIPHSEKFRTWFRLNNDNEFTKDQGMKHSQYK